MSYKIQELCQELRQLEAERDELKAKNKDLRSEVKLWKNRVDEAAKIVAEFEDIQAENKRLRSFLENLISIDNMLCLLPTPAISKDILPRQGRYDSIILLTCDKTSSPELFLKMVTTILEDGKP